MITILFYIFCPWKNASQLIQKCFIWGKQRKCQISVLGLPRWLTWEKETRIRMYLTHKWPETSVYYVKKDDNTVRTVQKYNKRQNNLGYILRYNMHPRFLHFLWMICYTYYVYIPYILITSMNVCIEYAYERWMKKKKTNENETISC